MIRLYKTTAKAGISCIHSGRTIRIVCRKTAIHISQRRLKDAVLKAFELWIVVIATLALFRLGQVYALQQRGFMAIGGEYTLLLLPLIYYVAKITTARLLTPGGDTSNK